MKLETQEKLVESFTKAFGEKPQVIFKAPGRVNLMGEHSDYNGGFVLPCAIDAYTYIAFSPSSDSSFHCISLNFPTKKKSWLSAKEQTHNKEDPWSNYLRGLTAEFCKAGHFLKPMNLMIASDVPMGCGLSSSAALQMSYATAMNEINKLALSPLELAQLAKTSENNFVGAQCGIMDQLVSGTAKKNHASLIDCESLTWQYVPLDPRWQVVVVNSGLKRTLTNSAFNTRVEECIQLREMISKELRSLSLKELNSYKSKLGDKLYRRARHVVTDSQRVSLLAEALTNYKGKSVFKLMSDSHRSMDQDFEMSTPEINALFHLLRGHLKDKGGIRLTGAGWGGALVALVPQKIIPILRDLVLEYYNLGREAKADFFCFQTAGGASQI